MVSLIGSDMDLICLLFVVLSPLLLASFVILSIFGFRDFSIPFLILSIASCLFGLLGFRFSIIVCLRRLGEEHFDLSKKLANYFSSNKKSVCFEKKQKWVCTTFGKEISFDLHGIVFKKTFLMAFVTRAIRYRVVSNQRLHADIGRFRLKGVGKSLIAFAIFSKGKKSKCYLLAKNDVSKPNFLTWLITYICAPFKTSFRFWNTQREGLMTGHYDEKSYCTSYKKRKIS